MSHVFKYFQQDNQNIEQNNEFGINLMLLIVTSLFYLILFDIYS